MHSLRQCRKGGPPPRPTVAIRSDPRTWILSTLWACLLAGTSPGVVATATAATPEATRQHWAFQPPRDVAPPAVKETAWPRTEVDRFILARLEADGRKPAPPADPRTLIRRMTFDLLGLPPTPDEVDRFVADAAANPGPNRGISPAVVGTLIDRLLASPRHGERWGRHWLDVARYSDTKGYVYAREERRFVHAPAYRDWVIRAFNDDLPYDRFLLLQLAADRLVPPESPDLAAMGFLTGGRRFIGVTHDIIDDRIDVVTRGTMALTVQCARCHDHKYDPVPIEDYYSLYGVFHGNDDRLVALARSDDAELAKRRKALEDGLAKRRAEAGARLRARIGDYLAAQLEPEKYPEEGFDQILSADDLIPASVRRWRDYLLTHRDLRDPILGPWHAWSAIPADRFEATAAETLASVIAGTTLNPLVGAAFSNPPKTMREVAERYGKLFAEAERDPEAPGAAELRAFLSDPQSPAVVPETDIINSEWFFPTSVTEELWKLQAEVDRRLIELGIPAAMTLADRPREPDPRVFLRGSPSRLGPPVPRRFLGLLSGPDRVAFRDGSGRLELARAIVDPANPLTARVMVNRIWQHHFGTGLVRTPSDFGLRSQPPTHPELLDWLARRFVRDGWSVKAVHRLILSSATYQQAGAASSAPVNLDGTPTYAGFPLRRLDFEQLRDAMLTTTGELDPAAGGKPVELLDEGNRRRTVYAMVDRQFLPGTLRTFDFANPDIHVAVRHETTVPQQALFFLNGPFVARRAEALAALVAELPIPDRVRRLHRELYQREPGPAEIEAARRFVEAAEADVPPPPPPPRGSAWRYGTGEYDDATGRLKSFTPLPHFDGTHWRGAAEWPGGASGWAQLVADGGHPGNTRQYACVRRWIAPKDTRISIAGTLVHEPEAGDGVRGFVVSSRLGVLGSATVHHSRTELAFADVPVQAGDTIDFVVDIRDNLNSDQFLWAPTLASDDARWDAREEFDGPRPAPRRLTPWAQYTQVLLLANEFAFVD